MKRLMKNVIFINKIIYNHEHENFRITEVCK